MPWRPAFDACTISLRSILPGSFASCRNAEFAEALFLRKGHANILEIKNRTPKRRTHCGASFAQLGSAAGQSPQLVCFA